MTSEQSMKKSAADALQGSQSTKEKLRNVCMTRGYDGLLDLGRLFRRRDKDRSNNLSLEELGSAINEIGLELSESELKELFAEIDTGGEGSIDYDELLAVLRPEMNESRKAIVMAAFASMDTTGDGIITVEDLKTKYRASLHPEVLNGSETEESILKRYLDRFEGKTTRDGKVTKNEFLDYYSGVSYSIDSDEYFIEVLTQSYNL